jgi:hypothetical protein
MQKFMRTSFIILILLYAWVAIPCYATHFVTVGPDNEDFGSLGAAITSLSAYTGVETEAVIVISPNKDQYANIIPYYNSLPYAVNLGSFVFTKLTIESANGTEHCTFESDSSIMPITCLGKVFQVPSY